MSSGGRRPGDRPMTRRRLDLNLLVIFDAIYRARNLTAAGEALGLSQPAMSHALARLREMFNDPLFVKLPRGLQPTPYADEVAPAVIQGLGTLRGSLEKAGFDPATSQRTFRFAMTDIGEWVLLPPLYRHVSSAAPRITLHTAQPSVRDLRDAMASGRIDLALGFIPQLGAGFRQQLMYRSSYACVVREGHPAIRDTLSLRQYREAAHVLPFSYATAHGETLERALQAASVNVAMRVTHFLALPSIIAGTDFITTIPINLAESMRQLVNVRVLPPPVELPGFDVKLYWHERSHLEPGNKWLRDVCAELMRR
jgi:DNA-binding transcriptional LysR family regulator